MIIVISFEEIQELCKHRNPGNVCNKLLLCEYIGKIYNQNRFIIGGELLPINTKSVINEILKDEKCVDCNPINCPICKLKTKG